MIQGKNRATRLTEFKTFSAAVLVVGSASIALAASTRQDRYEPWDTILVALSIVSAVVVFLSRRRVREPGAFFPIVVMQVLVLALVATTSNDTFRAMNLGLNSGIGAAAAWYFGTSPYRFGYLSYFVTALVATSWVAIGAAESWPDVIWATSVSGALALLIAIVIARLKISEERAAHEDALTGALNRRGLDKFIRDSSLDRRRSARSGLLLALDLDNFKGVNDTEGHLEGDRVLASFAATWRSVLRSSDCIARIGGDEFVVFLRGASRQDLELILERVWRIAPIGFSMGTVGIDTRQDFSDALRRADIALYSRKRERQRNDRVEGE